MADIWVWGLMIFKSHQRKKFLVEIGWSGRSLLLGVCIGRVRVGKLKTCSDFEYGNQNLNFRFRVSDARVLGWSRLGWGILIMQKVHIHLDRF